MRHAQYEAAPAAKRTRHRSGAWGPAAIPSAPRAETSCTRPRPRAFPLPSVSVAATNSSLPRRCGPRPRRPGRRVRVPAVRSAAAVPGHVCSYVLRLGGLLAGAAGAGRRARPAARRAIRAGGGGRGGRGPAARGGQTGGAWVGGLPWRPRVNSYLCSPQCQCCVRPFRSYPAQCKKAGDGQSCVKVVKSCGRYSAQCSKAGTGTPAELFLWMNPPVPRKPKGPRRRRGLVGWCP